MDDLINRQAAIDLAKDLIIPSESFHQYNQGVSNYCAELVKLQPAEPEQRCVNCGRTANNGGWYKDGRTRCPIEEHYALPKDGYCHLWEKRKVWEDDYVKRPEEGEK